MENLSGLLDLQNLDKEIMRNRREQERLPRKLTQDYNAALVMRKKLEDQKELVKKMKVQEKEKSVDLKTIEANITKKKGQLDTATTNVEYKNFLKEIEDQSKTHDQIEEKIIQLMESTEKENSQIPILEEQVKKISDEYELFRAEVEKELNGLIKEAKSLEKQRESKRAEIEKTQPGPLSEYERIFKNVKNIVLVLVQDGYCTSCHMEILAKDMADLLCRKIVYCEGCSRLLYLPENLN